MISPFSNVYMGFITPPNGLMRSLIFGWKLVLAGRVARRSYHQLILEDR